MAVSQTLSVTEVEGSVNNSANTSKVRILWQSTQTGDSWNGYTRVAKYYVSYNGGAEQEYSVSYTLPKGTTNTIVDTTITVAHNPDGTGTVRVRTWMDTSISAGVVEKSQTINLTTIPRASTISYLSNVTLGNACTVKWTPASKDFRFKLVFWVSYWSLTTGVIHPNITTLYTDSSYSIPIDVAEQFPNSKDAEMTVGLYTYSDAECTKQVGEVSMAKCRVYIPETEQTSPTVGMSTSPISSLSTEFNGLYIQNKTRVHVGYTGSIAKYGANIAVYMLNVDGVYQGNPYQSDLLAKPGIIPVTVTAVDTRGLSSSKTTEISVIPYLKPSLIPYTGESSIVCKRCDPNGNFNPSGTCLRIKVGRQYSKVLADGVQKNFSEIRYQYKTEGGASWSGWTTILPKDIEADSVDVTLTNIALSISTTYLVQIEAVDDIGESYSTLITIPTADVTVHLRAGGKAIGIGKYAEEDHIVDIDDEWELNARGDARVGGTFYPTHIEAIDDYSGKDFNDLVDKTGYYKCESAPSTVSCKNYPIAETGVLEVIALRFQNRETLAWWGFAYQTYRTYTGKVFTRSYYSDSVEKWTTWKEVNLT